jgi:hypothetical protein
MRRIRLAERREAGFQPGFTPFLRKKGKGGAGALSNPDAALNRGNPSAFESETWREEKIILAISMTLQYHKTGYSRMSDLYCLL